MGATELETRLAQHGGRPPSSSYRDGSSSTRPHSHNRTSAMPRSHTPRIIPTHLPFAALPHAALAEPRLKVFATEVALEGAAVGRRWPRWAWSHATRTQTRKDFRLALTSLDRAEAPSSSLLATPTRTPTPSYPRVCISVLLLLVFSIGLFLSTCRPRGLHSHCAFYLQLC